MSFYSMGSIRNAYAFDFGIPDIPFLNFNFDNSAKSDSKDSSSNNEATEETNLNSLNSNEIEPGDFLSKDETNSDLFNVKPINEFQTYDSLPFPSNTINNAIFGQTDEEEEKDESADSNEVDLNQISSYIPGTLPLISDFTNFPSTFFSEPDIKVGKAVPNQYIVILNDDSRLSDFLSTISDKVEFKGVEFLQIYEKVLNGLAIRVPNEQVIGEIEKLPMVKYVEKDVMTQAFAQTLPTGINRIDGDLSSTKSGNGDGKLDVDIAILDSGIDLNHSDLNVYHQKSFVNSDSGISAVFGSTMTTANDDNGHGTHLAGIAAAKDNNIGTVGVAPGAKLWAIKVLNNEGIGPLSTIIKGIDYVTQNANQIEVANMSLGCECKSAAFDTAINNAVKAGIVFVVASGNAGTDAKNTLPANNPNVISVSAIGDSDGKCGSAGPNTGYGNDDGLASFSNYGSDVDIAAPGTKIFSTYKGNTYATMSGTSMASPHVAGAAALYLANNPDATPSAVFNGLITQGSTVGTNCDGNGHGYLFGDKDQYKEPILYVKNY